MHIKKFLELLKIIERDHSLFNTDNKRNKRIKYIKPHIDTRTWGIYSIEFNNNKRFHCVNENAGLDLYEEIIKWLESEGY